MRRKKLVYDACVFDVRELVAILDGISSPHWQQAFRLWLMLWEICAEHYRDTTPGASLDVPLTREELADRMSIPPSHLSRLMATLGKLGAVSMDRKPVPGLRGPGRTTYTVHHVPYR